MKFIFQITARDIPHSEALEAHVRQKAEKLEAFYPHIMGCRVVIEVPHKHKHQGRAFNVRLDITVPGKELVVNSEADQDVSPGRPLSRHSEGSAPSSPRDGCRKALPHCNEAWPGLRKVVPYPWPLR